MVILILIFCISSQQRIQLALQDLSDEPLNVNGWNVLMRGILQSYQMTIQQCNQNLLKITPYLNIYQKTYSLPHFEFDEITIEMDVYFIQFSQSFIRIKIDQNIIYQQTFTSDILQITNICGGQDSQYTISQTFQSSQTQFNLSILYQTWSTNSYIGIRNINIYTNGYALSNGCSMDAPYLLDRQCVQYCTNSDSYLDGVDMLMCQSDELGLSNLIETYETTQQNLWKFSNPTPTVDQIAYLTQDYYLINENIYDQVMTSQLFSSVLICSQACFYLSQIIDDNSYLQITLIFYIFGEWNDGSMVGIYISGDTIYQNNMVRIIKFKGNYSSSTGSSFYFTKMTSTSGQLSTARRKLITFQGKFYSGVVNIGFSQAISGSGTYGFGNIYIYQAYNDKKILESGIYGIPYQCVQGYFAYNGYCVKNCPSYSFQDNNNNNCTDLSQQQSEIFDQNLHESNRIGTYIIKDFYENSFNELTIRSIFSLVPGTYNNYFNGQPFSFIGNKKILGGYNSWGHGSYGIQVKLPIHNQIRIQFKLYMIDNWSSTDFFRVNIDSQQTEIFYQNNPNIQIQGLNVLDEQIDVNYFQYHTSSTLKLIFICTLATKNPLLASCGISDLFVLYDQVINFQTQQYADVMCNSSSIYFSYTTNNCEQCVGTNCLLFPTNYYQDELSTKELFGCQERDQNLCLVCSQPSYQQTSANGLCECVDKYIISNFQCTPCHYSCDTCTGPSENECQSCDDTRQLIGQTCQCLQNFFDSFSQQSCFENISPCDYSCETCFGKKYYHCVTCPINSFRTKVQFDTCMCNQQYIDIGQSVCQKFICDPTCLTCDGVSSLNCLTCLPNFRFENRNCLCDGLFNNLINLSICRLDDINCNKISCQNQQIQGILDCDPYQFRYLNIISSQYQKCDCFYGYYEYQRVCLKCDSTCLTCQNTQKNCLSCNPDMKRQWNLNRCDCLPGYNDILAQGEQCVLNYSLCHLSCLDCFGSENNQCFSCSDFRVLYGSTCNCVPSRFESLTTFSCELCHPLCLTCDGSQFDNCLSCDQQLFRVLSQTTCICQNGSYEMDNICILCHYSCLTCSSEGSESCTDCDNEDFRFMNNNQCKCFFGYADIGNKLCEKCRNECNNCDSQLKCLSCKFPLQTLSIIGRCDCYQGYQKNNGGQCIDCQSYQGKALFSCQYQNAQDGIWTYGEQCDDGNYIIRDGCTQFTVDDGYQCDNLLFQPSICYLCPQNCLKCHYFNSLVQCQNCLDNYFLHQDMCQKCQDKNCKLCSSYSYCQQCYFDILPKNGQCSFCEEGYEYENRQCISICGDGFQTPEEQCDDQNIFDNDGCNSKCLIENGFICNPECKIEKDIIKTKLIDTGNQINKIQFEILFYDFDINNLDVKIEYFTKNDDFNFTTILISDSKFEIQFTFTKQIKQFNIIHIYLPIIQSKRMLDYQIREYQFTPVEMDYYDQKQTNQRQSIQNTQQYFYQSMAYIGPISIILGGANFFLQILDIISWINNFYYININYPGNVQIFFEKSNWGLIFSLPQIIEFQSEVEGELQVPRRFQDKGIDGLIINNIQQVVLIIFTITIFLYLSSRILKFIKWFQNRNKKTTNLFDNDLLRQQTNQFQQQQIFHENAQSLSTQIFQLTQKQNNGIGTRLTQQLQILYDNRYVLILQTMNTSILDIVLSILINFKYLTYFDDLILFVSFLFCILFILISLIFFAILYVIVNAHSSLKKSKMFRNLQNQLFDGLKQDKISRLYGFQAIFQKNLFIFSVVVFYETPLLQTLFSCSILLGLMIISIYKFPFSTFKDVLSQYIPDLTLAFILLLCCLLAADEQINYFTYQQRYNIGWIMLAIISFSILIQLLFIIKEAYQQLIIKYKWIQSILKQ